MSEASQQPETVVATGSWVWRVLGLLLGTATCISLVKNGFAIELYGLPLKIYQQYVWLRDMLFEPVVWVLRYFGLTMPWWLKDLIVAYGLIAGAHWRSERYFATRGFKYQVAGHDTLGNRVTEFSTVRVIHESRAHPLLRALLWPCYQNIKMTRITTGQKPVGMSGAGWETLIFDPPVLNKDPRTADLPKDAERRYRKLVLLNLLTIAACSAAFFLWSHLQNTFGPGG